jgi:hypothetical protein
MRSKRATHAQAPTCRQRTVTNRFAFEMHRYYLELELQRAKPIPPCVSPADPAVHRAMWYGGAWMGRYMRRIDAIEGVFDGPLADRQARQLLIARCRARDAADKTVPDWDPMLLTMINMALKNNSGVHGKMDVSSSTQPHSYGPSLRALWGQAKRLGKSDAEAWDFIVAWSRRRPACWDREDEKKRNGQPQGPPGLVERLARKLSWKRTDDLDYPWAAREVDGQDWQVRLNDFPDEVMYTLVIDGAAVNDFHDWPTTWQRD